MQLARSDRSSKGACFRIELITAPQWPAVSAASRLFCALLPEGWSSHAIASLLHAGRGRLWLAHAQAALAGAMLAERILDEMHLLQLAVHPSWRRRGLARALLAKLEEEPGIRRLLLEVRPSNRAAIALYRACRWRLIGKRRGYYAATQSHPAEDALVFVKELS